MAKAEETATESDKTEAKTVKPKKATSQSARFREILGVFNKYNVLGNLARQTNPEEVRHAFEELGPTFIKLGQMLSVRTDIVTQAFSDELQNLQDNVRADDFPISKQTIETELRCPLADVFSEFEEQPFASASIGQTHRATLLDGTKVAVKVQHPDIQEEITLDMSLLKKVLPIIKFIPDANVLNPKEVLEEVRTSLMDEVDYNKEAENGMRFYENNHGEGIIVSPRFFLEHCTRRVLVMEFMAGESLKVFLDREIEEAQQEEYRKIKKEIGDVLVKNYLKQVFEDGFFHADPHPGNILIEFTQVEALAPIKNRTKTKRLGNLTFQMHYEEEQELPPYRIAYLDFGMMGHLDQSLIDRLSKVVTSLYFNNTMEIGSAVLNLCHQTGPFQPDDFFEELSVFLGRYSDMAIGDMDFQQLFFQVVDICRRNNLQMDPAITMLVKAFATLEGVVQVLDPELSMIKVAIPFGEMYLRKQLNWGDVGRKIGWEFLSVAKALPKLPEKTVGALDIFNRGQAKLNLEIKRQDEIFNRVERLVNKLVVGLVLAAIIIGSSMLVEFSPHANSSFITSLGLFGYGASLATIIILALSALWKRIKRRK